MTSDEAPPVRLSRRDPRRWPWWVQTLGVYTVSRLWLVVVFCWVSGRQPANFWTPARPSYFDYVGYMFDGSWYRQIAASGYPATLLHGADGTVQQNAWAFFPAYPTLVRYVMQVTGGTWVVTAPLVSTALAGLAMLVVHRVVTLGAPRAVAAWPLLPLATVALLCAFPTSAVLQTAYTEALALLLVAATLWALLRRSYPLAALLVVLLGFTRAVALPMTVVVVAHGAWRWWAHRRDGDDFSVPDRVGVVGLAGVAVVSGFVWSWVAAWRTGVPDAYVLTQEAWRGVHRVTPFYAWSYAPQFFLGYAGGWAATVGGLVLVVALLVSPAARRLGPELNGWSVGYLGYIAAVIEPGSSLGRFLLLAFPMGTVTAGLVAGRYRRVWLTGVLVLMLVLQVVWVREIWLFTPPADWPP